MGNSLKLRLRTANLQGGGALEPSIATGELIPASYFGMHINRLANTTIWGDYDQNATTNYKQVPYPNIGIGTVRLWDSDGCSWRNIHRTRTTFVWDRLDNAVQIANTAGAKIIYTLGCGPDWATTQVGQKAGLYVGYNPHPPADIQYWIEWCTAVSTRYKGLGITYEIWNEVNDQTFGVGNVGSGFSGSITKLVELAKVAKETISAIDGTAKIMSPNFTTEDGIISSTIGGMCLDNYLAAGGGQYADIISIHGYNTLYPWRYPEGIYQHGTRIKQVLTKYNLTSPIWDTEWGFGRWVSEDGTTHMFPDSMSEQHGADYITRMVLVNWCSGLRLFCFYGLDASTSYATIKMIDVATPNVLLLPAMAYKYLSDLLVGGYVSGFQEMVDSSGKMYYKVNITTNDGRFGKVLWAPGYTTASIHPTNIVQITDNVGNIVPITETVVITKSPKFLYY